MKKGVCLISGGIDSYVAAKTLLDEEDEFIGLFFSYGQEAWSEEKYHAIQVCNDLDIEFHDINCKSAFRGMPSGIIGGEGDEFVVHQRNLVFLSLAASVCQYRYDSNSYICVGFSDSDASEFPDCRKEFVDSAEETINISSEYTIQVDTPLIDKTKQQVVEEGVQEGCDLDKTFSCYYPNGRSACGECLSCRERKIAIRSRPE